MKSARIEFDEDAKENTTLFNLPFEGSKDEIAFNSTRTQRPFHQETNYPR
jgi:hypothetical protein